MTKDDKIIWELTGTIRNDRPMGIHGTYMKNYEKDLHLKDDILFMEIKLVVPVAIREPPTRCYMQPIWSNFEWNF